MEDTLKAEIERSLSEALSQNVRISSFEILGGGSIHRAGKLESNAGSFFLKTLADDEAEAMYRCEADGLDLLRRHSTFYIPKVITRGRGEGRAFLVLEYISPGEKRKGFYEEFARKLAAMHRVTQDRFGLEYDNYIGSLPQSNRFHADWNSFYIEERILPMLRMARDKGLLRKEDSQRFDRLFLHVNSIFPQEAPALLHGDLWGGNHMAGPRGEAVIYDPAVHFGHREMELAFTSVFFGYPSEFYDAYEAAWPLQAGFKKRAGFYQLWPLLVHLNLFGSSYLPPIQRILSVF